MLNQYNSYLPKLSTVIEPLCRLLKKGIKFQWGPDQNNAFSAAKSLLCSAPVLTHFDFSLPIVVYCDPSPYGVGVVLTHIFRDNSEKPVCYTSCTLSPAEKNYAHIEKNMLAVIFAIRKLHQYLYGHVFKIITDHNRLLGLFGQNKATPPMASTRIQR